MQIPYDSLTLVIFPNLELLGASLIFLAFSGFVYVSGGLEVVVVLAFFFEVAAFVSYPRARAGGEVE